MINIYDHLKYFHFNMPGGWTPKKIGIFVESCRFHHSDLKKTTKDFTRWRRIALFGAKIAQDETLFNVNNCIELAQCLRSYAERNFERLGYDSNFLQYLRDIQDLVDYFPKVGVLDVTDPSFNERAKRFEDDLLQYINSKASSHYGSSDFTPALSITSNNSENHEKLLSELKSKRERVIESVKNHDRLLSDLRSKRKRVIQKAKKKKNSLQKKKNQPATTLFTEINDLLIKRGAILGLTPLTNPPSTDVSEKSNINTDITKDVVNEELVESMNLIKLDNCQLYNRSQVLVSLSSGHYERPPKILDKEALGKIGVRVMDDNEAIDDLEQLNNKINYASSSSNNMSIRRNSFDINKVITNDIQSKNMITKIDTFKNESKDKFNYDEHQKPQDKTQEFSGMGLQKSAPLKSEIESHMDQSKENNKDSKVVEVIINKMITEIAADFATSESIVEAVNFLKEDPEVQRISVKEEIKETKLSGSNFFELASEIDPSPTTTSKYGCCNKPAIAECASDKNTLKTIQLGSNTEKNQVQDCDSSAYSIDKTASVLRSSFDLEGSTSDFSTQKVDNKKRPFKKRGRSLKQKLQEEPILEHNDNVKNLPALMNFPNIPYSARNIIPTRAEVSLSINGTVISPADTSSTVDEGSLSFRSSGENSILPGDAVVVSSTIENTIDSKGSLENVFPTADIDSTQVPTKSMTGCVVPMTSITPKQKGEVTCDAIMNMTPAKKINSGSRIRSKHDEARCSDTLQPHTASEMGGNRILDTDINCGNNTSKNCQTPTKQKKGRAFKSACTKVLENNELHLPLRNTSVNIEDKNRPFKKRELSKFKEMFNTDNKQNEFTQPLENGPSVSGEELRKRKLSSELESSTEYILETEKHGDKTEYFVKHKNNLINFIPSVKLVDCMLHPRQFGAYSIINQPKYKTLNKKAKIDREDFLNFTVAFKTPEEESITSDNGKKKYNDNRKLIAKNKARRLCNYGKREHSVTTKVRQQTRRTRMNSKQSFTLSSDRISQTEISITISADGRIFKDIAPMRKVDAKKTFTSLPHRKGRKSKLLSVLPYQPLSKENILSDRMLRLRKGRLTGKRVGCQESSITSSDQEILTVFPVSVGDIPLPVKEEHQNSPEVSSTEKADETNQSIQQNSKPSTSSSEKNNECEQSSVSFHEQTSTTSHEREEVHIGYDLPRPEETIPIVPQDQYFEAGISLDNNRKLREGRGRQPIKAKSNQEQCKISSDKKEEESTEVGNLTQVEENSPAIRSEKSKAPKKVEGLKCSTLSEERDRVSAKVSHHQQSEKIISVEGNKRLRERKVKPSMKTENQESSGSSSNNKANESESEVPNMAHSEEITTTDVGGKLRGQKERQSIKKVDNQESTTPSSLENEGQESSDVSDHHHEQNIFVEGNRRLRERKDNQVIKKEDRKEHSTSSSEIKESMRENPKTSYLEENPTDGSEKLKGRQLIRNVEDQESKSINSKRGGNQKTLSVVPLVENCVERIPVDGTRQLRERKTKTTIRKGGNQEPSSTSSEKKDNKPLTDEITTIHGSDRLKVLNDKQSKKKIGNKEILPVSSLKKIEGTTSSDELHIQRCEQNISVEVNKWLRERKAKLSVKKEDNEDPSSISKEKSESTPEVSTIALSKENTTGDGSERLKTTNSGQSVKKTEDQDLTSVVSERECRDKTSSDATFLSPHCESVFSVEGNISLRERKGRQLIKKDNNMTHSMSLGKKDNEPSSEGTNSPHSKESTTGRIDKLKVEKDKNSKRNTGDQESMVIISEKENGGKASSNSQPCEETISLEGNRRRKRKCRLPIKNEDVQKHSTTISKKTEKDLTSHIPNLPHSEENSSSHERGKIPLIQKGRQSINNAENQDSTSTASLNEIEEKASSHRTHLQHSDEISSIEENKRQRVRKSRVLFMKEDKMEPSAEEFDSEIKNEVSSNTSHQLLSAENILLEGNRKIRKRKSLGPIKNDYKDSSILSHEREDKVVTPDPHNVENILELDNRMPRRRKCRSPTNNVYKEKIHPASPKSEEKEGVSLDVSHESHCIENLPADEKRILRERKGKSPTKKEYNQGPSTSLKENIVKDSLNVPQNTHYLENLHKEEKRVLRERKDKSPTKKVYNQGSFTPSTKGEKGKEVSPDPSQIPHCVENIPADEKRILRERKDRPPTKIVFDLGSSTSLKENISSEMPQTPQCVENLPTEEKRVLRERKDKSPIKKVYNQGSSTASTKGEKSKEISPDPSQTPCYVESLPAEEKRVLREMKDKPPTTKVLSQGPSTISTKGENNTGVPSVISYDPHYIENNTVDGKRILRERKGRSPTKKVDNQESLTIALCKEDKEEVSSYVYSPSTSVKPVPSNRKRRLRERKGRSPLRQVDEYIPISLQIDKGEVVSVVTHQLHNMECNSDNVSSGSSVIQNNSSMMKIDDQKIKSTSSVLSSENGERRLGEGVNVNPLKNDNKKHSISSLERENKDFSLDNAHPLLLAENNCVEGSSEIRERKGQIPTKNIDTYEPFTTSFRKRDKDEISSHLVTDENKKLRSRKVVESVMKEDKEASLISLERVDKEVSRSRKRKKRSPIKNLNNQEHFPTTLRSDKQELSEDTISLAHVKNTPQDADRFPEMKRRSPKKNVNRQNTLSMPHMKDAKERVSWSMTSQPHYVENIPAEVGNDHGKSVRKDVDKQKDLATAVMKNDKVEVSSGITSQSCYIENMSADVRDDNGRSSSKDAGEQKALATSLIKNDREEILPGMASHKNFPVDDRENIERCPKKDVDKQESVPISLEREEKEDALSDISHQPQTTEAKPVDAFSNLRDMKDRSLTKNVSDQDPSTIFLQKEGNAEIMLDKSNEAHSFKNIPVDGKRRLKNRKERLSLKKADKELPAISLEIKTNDILPDLNQQLSCVENKKLREDNIPPITRGEEEHFCASPIREDKLEFSSHTNVFDDANSILEGSNDKPPVKAQGVLETSITLVESEDKSDISSGVSNEAHPIENISTNDNQVMGERNSKLLTKKDEIQEPRTSVSIIEEDVEVSSNESLQPYSVENVPVDNKTKRLRKRKGGPLDYQESSLEKENKDISSTLSQEYHSPEYIPVVWNKESIIVSEKVSNDEPSSDSLSQSISKSNIPDIENCRFTLEGLPPTKRMCCKEPTTTFHEGNSKEKLSSELSLSQHSELNNLLDNGVGRLREQNVFPSIMEVCSTEASTKWEGEEIVSSDKSHNSVSHFNITTNANDDDSRIQKSRSPTQNVDHQEPQSPSTTSVLEGKDEESDLSHLLYSQEFIPADKNKFMERNVSSPQKAVNDQEPYISCENDDQENQSSNLPELHSEESADTSNHHSKKRHSSGSSSEMSYSKDKNKILMARKSLSPTSDMYSMPSTSGISHPKSISDNENKRLRFKKDIKGMKRKNISVVSKFVSYSSSSSEDTFQPLYPKIFPELVPIEEPDSPRRDCNGKSLSPYEHELARERFSVSPLPGDVERNRAVMPFRSARFSHGQEQDHQELPLQPVRQIRIILAPEQQVRILGPEQEVRIFAPEQEMEIVAPEQQVRIVAPEQQVRMLAPEQQVRQNHIMDLDYENEEGFRYSYDYNDPEWFCQYARNVGRWQERKLEALHRRFTEERRRKRLEDAATRQRLETLFLRYNVL